MIAPYTSDGYAFVPRNIMCSKKCAKPDLPGSTSLREPVCTGIRSETRFGNPVGTTMTLRPLGSVFSDALKGRMSLGALVPWPKAETGSTNAQRTAVRKRERNIVLLFCEGLTGKAFGRFLIRDVDRTFFEVFPDDEVEEQLTDA